VTWLYINQPTGWRGFEEHHGLDVNTTAATQRN
jgi:hypothetical protein